MKRTRWVYHLTFPDGETYVGCSTRPNVRKAAHEAAFQVLVKMELLEEVPPGERWGRREQAWIAKLKPTINGRYEVYMTEYRYRDLGWKPVLNRKSVKPYLFSGISLRHNPEEK